MTSTKIRTQSSVPVGLIQYSPAGTSGFFKRILYDANGNLICYDVVEANSPEEAKAKCASEDEILLSSSKRATELAEEQAKYDLNWERNNKEYERDWKRNDREYNRNLNRNNIEYEINWQRNDREYDRDWQRNDKEYDRSRQRNDSEYERDWQREEREYQRGKKRESENSAQTNWSNFSSKKKQTWGI